MSTEIILRCTPCSNNDARKMTKFNLWEKWEYKDYIDYFHIF